MTNDKKNNTFWLINECPHNAQLYIFNNIFIAWCT